VLAGVGHWLPEQHAAELSGPLLAHLRRWPARPGRRPGMGVVTLDAVVIGGGPAEAGGRHLAGPLPADRAGAGQRRVPQPLGGGLPRLPRPRPGGPGRAAGRARAELAAYPTAEIRAAKMVKVAADGVGGSRSPPTHLVLTSWPTILSWVRRRFWRR
jgi:hypothetical protein